MQVVAAAVEGLVRLDCDLGGATINQVTLPATDHAASFAFYRALGFTPIVDSGGRYARFEAFLHEAGLVPEVLPVDRLAVDPGAAE